MRLELSNLSCAVHYLLFFVVQKCTASGARQNLEFLMAQRARECNLKMSSLESGTRLLTDQDSIKIQNFVEFQINLPSIFPDDLQKEAWTMLSHLFPFACHDTMRGFSLRVDTLYAASCGSIARNVHCNFSTYNSTKKPYKIFILISLVKNAFYFQSLCQIKMFI